MTEPSLDISSTEFDPLLALQCPEKDLATIIPSYLSSAVPVYDNIAQWHQAMLSGKPEKRQRPQSEKSNSYLESRQKKLRMLQLRQERSEAIQTRFQEHCVERFYQRLDKIGKERGPLSMLYDLCKSHGWVRVAIRMTRSIAPAQLQAPQTQDDRILEEYQSRTRGSCDISAIVNIEHRSSPNERGFIIGQLICFDKHMNLVMENVLEGITNRICLARLGLSAFSRSRRKPPRPKRQVPYPKVYWRTWPTMFLPGAQIIHIQRIG